MQMSSKIKKDMDLQQTHASKNAVMQAYICFFAEMTMGNAFATVIQTMVTIASSKLEVGTSIFQRIKDFVMYTEI